MTAVSGSNAYEHHLNKLQEDFQKITAELEALESDFVLAGTEKMPDPTDQGAQVAERHNMAAHISRLKAKQKQIKAALDRGEEYGECVECLELINPKRLEFNPALITCVDCQELLDRAS